MHRGHVILRSLPKSVGLLLLATMLFAACTSSEEGEKAAPSPAPSKADSTPSRGWSDQIKVKKPDGTRLLEIKLREDEVKVELGDEGSPRVLRGEIRTSGKRKYALDGGAPIAEIKSSDDGFKLKSADDDRLLWKVKIKEEKITIADNEEGTNAYELKLRDDKVKIEEDGKELGAVKFYPDRKKVKVKSPSDEKLFESNTDRMSAAFGLLLMNRIPETERAILMGELLSRGK